MKQRFSAFDVKCIAAELKRYIGMRVANIYDVNAKTYLLKLAKPEEKVFLVVESGIRIHTTEFSREKNTMPSAFSMKLRKHIRTRRLSEVKQLGIDRVIQLQFGEGETAYHLFIEFYSSGNVVLTDHEMTILSLLRTAAPTEDVKFAVKEQYNTQLIRHFKPVTKDLLIQILSGASPGDNIKKVLNTGLDHGPAIVDHCCMLAGIPSSSKVSDVDFGQDSQQLDVILKAFQEGDRLLQADGNFGEGYIIIKTTPKAGADTPLKTNEEFHPVLFKQFEGKEYLKFGSFNEAVDTFFSSLEEQKMEVKAHQQEVQAVKKIEAIREDHENRLKGLEEAQEANIRKARLIQENIQLVDAALQIIRSALANSMPWDDIQEMVEEEKKKGHPVALAISSLKFQTNQITMLLSDWLEDDSDFSDQDSEEEEEEEEEVQAKGRQKGGKGAKGKQPAPKGKQKRKPTKVDIDLDYSAFANATRYYDQKRSSSAKFQKTVEASKKALTSAEKKINKEIRQVKVTTSINKMRKAFWFEKFLWFVSSENYLVIGGRDMQQNELLVKRYFRKGDVYVHADIHGAATIIIKNSSGNPISPITLAQAGAMAVCYSSAWDAKIVTSAWWVNFDQVSKTAPTGEYLTTGSFMIRGKKNFLPPAQLVMGFGVLFRLDDTCIANHLGERKVKVDPADIEAATTGLSIDHEKYGLKLEEYIRTSNPKESQEASKGKAGKPPAKPQEPIAKKNKAEAGPAPTTPEDANRKKEDSKEAGDEGESDGDAESGNDHQEESEEEEDEEKDEEEEEEDDDDEEDSLFPDTVVQVKAQGASGAKAAPARQPPPQQESSSEDEEEDKSEDQGKAGKYRTAAEKRLAKKAAQKGITVEEMQQRREQNQPRPSKQGETSQPNVPQQTQAPRGKKGKLKKIKEKYADQDEEDRRLRLEILAPSNPKPAPPPKKGGKQPQQKQQPAKQGQQKQAGKPQQSPKQPPQGPAAKPAKPEAKVEEQRPDEAPKEGEGAPAGEGTAEAEAEGQPQGEDQGEGKKGKGRAEARAAKKKEEEDLKQLLAEENILDEEEMMNLSLLDTLTGKPLGEDVLLFAIPVCAPYSALINYKYKVKLTPGTAKKGKAIQTALASFTQAEGVTERERDLMKSIPDPAMISTMMGKVKISTPNLEKLKASAKKKGGKK